MSKYTNYEQVEGERTLELFRFRGLVINVDTFDIALHFAYEEFGDSAFRFGTLCHC